VTVVSFQSGPVKTPSNIAHSKPPPSTSFESNGRAVTSATIDRIGGADGPGLSSENEQEDGTRLATGTSHERPRKRRRLAESDDLEASYFKRLEKEERRERSQQFPRTATSDSGTNSDGDDDLVAEDEAPTDAAMSDEEIPRHETLENQDIDNVSQRKLSRTVFLGNVSIEAIRSKKAKKTLIKHLQSVLKPDAEADAGKVESIRFRSTAFASSVGPKRAAFAKKELMDKTMKSTNAYVVFSNDAAAKTVASKLNGTVILDRHLRVDYLANPAEIHHRRCVFVGNLNFVDEETVEEDGGQDGTNRRRPKAKEPADAEEGLWRTFSKAGQVESVRVVRDQQTRIGKGFAYVQFADENGVEAALLMNDKKFPPMLPRKLRVMRAKRTKQKGALATSGRTDREKHHAGKFKKGGGNHRTAGPGKNDAPPSSRIKTAGVVFEGHRASSQSKPRTERKRYKVKPDTRSSRRGAAFKAGGKHKRDAN